MSLLGIPALLLGATLLTALPSLAGSGTQQKTPQPILAEPLNPSGIYEQGERVGWMVSNVAAPGAPTAYHYTLLANDDVLISSGDLDLARGPRTIAVNPTSPEMLWLKLAPSSGGAELSFGAAFEPTQLQPVDTKPKDFDTFWKRHIQALERVPINPKITPQASPRAGIDYGTIQMNLVGGEFVYGQIARPSGPGKHPAVLILQWASPPYPLQPDWVLNYATKGWIALNIEPHNVLPREPQSYYNALPNELKNYASMGEDSRETNYFLNMYLRDYRAVDYLASLPDWDGKTLLVTGTSMGGQQSLCVTGLHPKVTHMIVEEPSGCDMNAALHGRHEGYPSFPSDNPQVMDGARYFDAINFAGHIHAQSLVAMGFVDSVAPPAGIWTAYNQIKGRKEVAPMRDAPHNNIATYEQQRPYYDRSTQWVDALSAGRAVP